MTSIGLFEAAFFATLGVFGAVIAVIGILFLFGEIFNGGN